MNKKLLTLAELHANAAKRALNVNPYPDDEVINLSIDEPVVKEPTMCDALIGSIASAVAEGAEWPNDAVYRIEYTLYSWPNGRYDETEYFTTVDELLGCIDGLDYFARLEDNQRIINSIQEWDLGPYPITLDEVLAK